MTRWLFFFVLFEDHLKMRRKWRPPIRKTFFFRRFNRLQSIGKLQMINFESEFTQYPFFVRFRPFFDVFAS